MARVHDLGCPELSGLLGLLVEESPLNARGFAVAARVSPATGRETLKRLERMGIVEVRREERGATEILSITLTPLGRQLAEHVRAMDILLSKAKR